MHTLVGFIITSATLGVGIKAWQKIGKIIDNGHSYFAFPVIFLIAFIGIFGIITKWVL